MPAEPEPESVDFFDPQNTAPLLRDAHSVRIAQWAASWAECFRSDSSSDSSDAETLMLSAHHNESARHEPQPPSTPSS